MRRSARHPALRAVQFLWKNDFGISWEQLIKAAASFSRMRWLHQQVVPAPHVFTCIAISFPNSAFKGFAWQPHCIVSIYNNLFKYLRGCHTEAGELFSAVGECRTLNNTLPEGRDSGWISLKKVSCLIVAFLLSAGCFSSRGWTAICQGWFNLDPCSETEVGINGRLPVIWFCHRDSHIVMHKA